MVMSGAPARYGLLGQACNCIAFHEDGPILPAPFPDLMRTPCTASKPALFSVY